MILITICGRGGSKGVQNKNIREISGKPLIAFAIEIAFEFEKSFPAIISLSTDSETILSVSKSLGIDTDYLRAQHLATDSSGKIEVIKDLLFYEENKHNTIFDYIVDLDITSPLRTVKDLERGYDILSKHPVAVNLFSVSPARKNPYFNMVEQKPDGFVKIAKPTSGNILSRQSAPHVFDINASFYIYKREFFREGFTSPVTDRSLMYIMPEFCIDIDDEMDFKIIKYLIESDLVKTK